jgi:hypothetical protein
MFANVKVIGADSSSTTDGAQKDLLVVAGKARMYTVTAYNSTAGTLYLQAHDSAAAAAEGEKPKLVVPVFALMSGGLNFVDGAIFKAGIYLCWSTTDVTKTLVGSVSGIIDATYRV